MNHTTASVNNPNNKYWDDHVHALQIVKIYKIYENYGVFNFWKCMQFLKHNNANALHL